MGWFGRGKKGARLDVAELARRLELAEGHLRSFKPGYHTFRIPKRAGGARVIMAPDDATKELQRRLLRRLLGQLSVNGSAMGFEPGYSVVDHAAQHARRAVIIKMDVKDFFPSTRADRVLAYFGRVGWDAEAAEILTRLTTAEGGLPQGAPTSPRLSNLVNYQLDEKLDSMAISFDANYSRYADDLVFSLAEDDRAAVGSIKYFTRQFLAEVGYQLHPNKTHVRRAHQRQTICGLVVNQGVALPRKTRRWLRAVEHRTFMGGQPSLTAQQLSGWAAYRQMIIDQWADLRDD